MFASPLTHRPAVGVHPAPRVRCAARLRPVASSFGGGKRSRGALVVTAALPEAVTSLQLFASSPAGVASIAAGAVAAALASFFGGVKSQQSAPTARQASPPPPPPPPPAPVDAVLVFGAAGRLGREVVAALLAEGRFVVAACRDVAKAQALLPASPKLLLRGGVDVTKAETLNEALFAGCTQAVVCTGALFGPQPSGGMGYIDGMTSERVDGEGTPNIAVAAAKHLPRPFAGLLPPVVTFSDAAAVDAWRAMNDTIMGGGSESAWSAPPAPGDAAEWAGELRLPGGGFCGTRLDGLRLDLSASDGLALTLASAPPQRYKLSLRTSANEGEGKSETTYQAVLDLSGREAGEWVTLRVPWSAFVAVKRQNEDVSAPKLDASAVRSLGLVLSRFEFNGLPNPCFTEGRFSLKVKSIAPFASPRPALVHVSSAGAERSARISDDAEQRAADIPIVQLNPGGVLTHKYVGETAIRSQPGLRYTILRPTGLDASADAAAPLEFGQGDWMVGKLSRGDVAAVVASALRSPSSTGVTAEVRRSEAAADAGKGRGDVAASLRRLVSDSQRTAAGYRPLPAPTPVPPPPSPEAVAKIMASASVVRVQAATDAAKVKDAEAVAAAKEKKEPAAAGAR